MLFRSGFSAYLKSDFFKVATEQGQIELVELDDRILPAVSEAIVHIKEYFMDRYRRDQGDIIQSWKDEDSYPYSPTDTTSEVEDAERRIFDIVALNIHDYVGKFEATDIRQKKLQFKLIKQAIETNPSDLKRIIEEVLTLPTEKIAELTELLETTSLSAIISVSSKVANRLAFIKGLEEVIFDSEMKRALKERTQLHRILADNPWLFGEEYSLGVDDQSLSAVLRKHLQTCGMDCVVDEPVTRVDGRVGIVDLMLTKAIPKNHAEEREHLIIELKAPHVKIDSNEIVQIESYALAVASDERFHGLNVRWEFWVISNSIGKHAEMRLKDRGHQQGAIFESSDPSLNYTIRVRTWSQILQEARYRHEFVRSQLNISIQSEQGLSYLKDRYAKYLSGVVE